MTPHALGIQTIGGYCDTIVERNSSIPLRATRTFSTSRDGQTQVKLQVLEGESRMAADNRPLGRLTLQGLPSAPRGGVQIDVTFEIDTDGLLNVTARDKTSGLVQRAQLSIAGTVDAEERDALLAQDLPAMA